MRKVVMSVSPLPYINILDFGAKADDKTDILPAINAALEKLKTGGPGGELYIPKGSAPYYCSGTINVHSTVRIVGDGGSAATLNPGSVIRFPANVSGIVLHEYRTTDDGGGSAQPSGLGDAQGSRLEGFAVWGGGAKSFSGPYTNPANTDRLSHGIWVRTFSCEVQDVSAAFFGGNGVSVWGTAGASGVGGGQASLFCLKRVQAIYNAMDGVCVWGSDANSGKVDQCSAISNGACGFREYSFYGNTYVACHTRDNGIGDPILSGALGGTCTYGGKTYYIRGQMDGNAQEILASMTVPGTNDAVWRQWNIGGSPPPWVSGQTWRISGPYVTNPGNLVANNLFLGMYAETGQAPSQSTKPSLWIGGSIRANGFDDSGQPGTVYTG